MGVFYMELSHFGAAEGALSHAGRIKSAIFPHGHESISKSETIVDIFLVDDYQLSLLYCS
jgi:hypothetical protein